MGQWTAKCWLGSSSGYQQLTVQSNIFHGATEQLKQVYGTEQIIDLHEVRGSNNTNSSSSSSIKLPGFKTIIAGGLILAAISAFGGKSDKNPAPVVESQVPQAEAVYEKQVAAPAVTYQAQPTYTFEKKVTPVESYQPAQMDNFLSEDYSNDTHNNLGQAWDK